MNYQFLIFYGCLNKQHLPDPNTYQLLLDKIYKKYQQIRNGGVKAWWEERQRRDFTARQNWPGDPEADLRRKLCGLSVRMVTGVCRISNPIQPASLFSITISVKKRGRCAHDRAKLKPDSQLASLLDILKCQTYACNVHACSQLPPAAQRAFYQLKTREQICDY